MIIRVRLKVVVEMIRTPPPSNNRKKQQEEKNRIITASSNWPTNTCSGSNSVCFQFWQQIVFCPALTNSRLKHRIRLRFGIIVLFWTPIPEACENFYSSSLSLFLSLLRQFVFSIFFFSFTIISVEAQGVKNIIREPRWERLPWHRLCVTFYL